MILAIRVIVILARRLGEELRGVVSVAGGLRFDRFEGGVPVGGQRQVGLSTNKAP